jgi:hypothetical protein
VLHFFSASRRVKINPALSFRQCDFAQVIEIFGFAFFVISRQHLPDQRHAEIGVQTNQLIAALIQAGLPEG